MVRLTTVLFSCVVGLANAVPHNQRTNLLPPDGTSWRGSEIGALKDPKTGVVDPQAFLHKYGVPMHIYRHFAPTPEHKSGISPPVRKFVESGGILWYNLAPPNWEAVAKGEIDTSLDWYVEDIKSVSPALVYVCVFHEADHNVDPSEGRSVEAYHTMWAYVQDYFAKHDVKNVVWAMDFSVKIADFSVQKAGQQVEALWPGADRIDWIFFNIFEHSNERRNHADFHALLSSVYNALERNSTHQCPAGGACGFTSKPWGLGAFATLHDVDPAEQIRFLKAARQVWDLFPRLRAFLYYDNRDSSITKDLVGPYEEFLKDPHFTANDGPEEEDIIYS